jgi:L-threonylcarbamoyladenylate synthase
MHPRHYQPRTSLYFLGEQPNAGRGAILRIGREMPTDPRAYAATLYEMLHRLDAESWDWIAVERPPDTPEWSGVLDRLKKAASGAD